jgi:hypothetical protein
MAAGSRNCTGVVAVGLVAFLSATVVGMSTQEQDHGSAPSHAGLGMEQQIFSL